MARYIDADYLKERLLKISVVADDLYGMGINRGLDRAETEIDMAPTVDVATDFNVGNKSDVVKVVRCKDCYFFREYSGEYKAKTEVADGDCYIRVLCSVDEQFNAVQYDDFCSYGERKEQ